MSDGKAVGKKRKRKAIAEDEEHCTRLHAELTLLINKRCEGLFIQPISGRQGLEGLGLRTIPCLCRVQDVNAYVTKRLQKLKAKEVKSRGDHQDQLTSIEERYVRIPLSTLTICPPHLAPLSE